jgi:uncharacterized phage-associated protein
MVGIGYKLSLLPQPEWQVSDEGTDGVRVTRKSLFTQRRNTMTFPVLKSLFDESFRAWQHGQLIQDAFPTLTADEREFLISGATPEEWAEAFPPQKEEED